MYSGNVKILFGEQKMYDAALAELNNMLPKVLALNQAGTIDMRDFKEGQATTVFKPEKQKKKKSRKKLIHRLKQFFIYTQEYQISRIYQHAFHK